MTLPTGADIPPHDGPLSFLQWAARVVPLQTRLVLAGNTTWSLDRKRVQTRLNCQCRPVSAEYFSPGRGSDKDGERHVTQSEDEVDPQAWLSDVLARINDHRARDLHQLLPWNWAPNPVALAA